MKHLTLKGAAIAPQTTALNISQDILRLTDKANKAPIKARLKFYSLVTARLTELNELVTVDETITLLPTYQKAILKCIEINNNL